MTMIIQNTKSEEPKSELEMATGSIPLAWSGLRWHVAVLQGDGLGGLHGQSDGRSAIEYGLRFFRLAQIPAFVPAERRKSPRNGSGKRRKGGQRFRPIMPGYIFVGDSNAALAAIRSWESGPLGQIWRCPVKGLLSVDGKALLVSSFAMQAMFALQERNWQIDADSLQPGMRVRIQDEAMAGVVGVINKILSGDRIEILAELFGREVAVKLPVDSLVIHGA